MKKGICLLSVLILLMSLLPVNALATSANHTHTYTDWQYNFGEHYKNCTAEGCYDVFFVEAHYGGTATCTEAAVCIVCGYAYEEPNENHNPDTSKWVARGEMYHFHKCIDCGAHCDIEDHRWSPRHHSVGAKGHAYQCADCKGYDVVLPHEPGPAATETQPQTCKVCQYVIAPATGPKPTQATTPTVPETTQGETTPETTAATVPETQPETTANTLPATTEPQETIPEKEDDPSGFPWWAVILVALAAILLGVGIGVVILIPIVLLIKKKKKNKEG